MRKIHYPHHPVNQYGIISEPRPMRVLFKLRISSQNSFLWWSTFMPHDCMMLVIHSRLLLFVDEWEFILASSMWQRNRFISFWSWWEGQNVALGSCLGEFSVWNAITPLDYTGIHHRRTKRYCPRSRLAIKDVSSYSRCYTFMNAWTYRWTTGMTFKMNYPRCWGQSVRMGILTKSMSFFCRNLSA